MTAAIAAIYPVAEKDAAKQPAKAQRGAALKDSLAVWPLFTHKESRRFERLLKQLQERAR